MASFTPVNQVRLTNVAVVRLKRGGKRFEIACYKNKVVNWRNGVEADLDEVLQIDSVFQNVSRGVLAKRQDLEKCFGTSDKEEVCKFILKKGQLQVSEKERQVANNSLFRDIAAIVSEKCINSETRRPFTVNMIEKTMRNSLHYAVKHSKTAKQQALEVIRLLENHLPLVRAKMRIRVAIPASQGDKLRMLLVDTFGAEIQDNADQVQTNFVKKSSDISSSDTQSIVCRIQPGKFRAVDELVKSVGGQGLEVLDMHVQDTGETDISDLGRAISGMSIADKDAEQARLNSHIEDEPETLPTEDYVAPAAASKKRKKKKKKKRRGIGQESRKHDDDSHSGKAELQLDSGDLGFNSMKAIDLCGYMYRPYKSTHFVVSVYDHDEVNTHTREPSVKSKWYIFGAGEKPALWNQKENGWLVSKKYEDKLDVAGAIPSE